MRRRAAIVNLGLDHKVTEIPNIDEGESIEIELENSVITLLKEKGNFRLIDSVDNAGNNNFNEMKMYELYIEYLE